MKFHFTKMHGLGNDFMVIDGINQSIDLTPKTIKTLARRDIGIGFDQCLIIEKSRQTEFDFYYRIFNADGTEVGQCGNGARCLGLFVKHYGLSDKKILNIYTKTTQMRLQINPDNTVTVKMGIPKFHPEDIPLLEDTEAKAYQIALEDNIFCEIHALSLGNPHAVMLVDSIETAPVNTLGKQISEHALFPEETNAGFMQILSKNHIALRVYERGCGETRACGSGAAAAAIIARRFYNLEENIKVSLPGGDLNIFWPNEISEIELRGPATFIYEGVIMEEGTHE